MYFTAEEFVRQSKSYQPMLAAMETEIEECFAQYEDDSRLLSGWGHAYFCPDDGGVLQYDRTKPSEHRCSVCSRIYRGFSYDSAFITMMRNDVIVHLIKAGILYRITKKETYQQRIVQTIAFYAENYDRFAVHAKEKIVDDTTIDVGGAGKIMPQGLNEAILAIRMVGALQLIKETLSLDWLQWVKTTLFAPLVALLTPQKQHIHNIPCWINSAIGVLGFFFNEQDWIKEADQNSFHIHEQIAKGVTQNGFWYEGSIHYNFFALEGILNYFVFAQEYQHPVCEASKRTLLHMLDAAYHYAFENDSFPNPCDGWPDVTLKTYSHIYYMAYKAFGAVVVPYLMHIEKNPRLRTRVPLSEPYYYNNQVPLECLLFYTGENLEGSTAESGCVEALAPRVSKSFESSNCAMLRQDGFEVFFKYGHQTISHAHPDKMNIEVMMHDAVLSRDLSNAGYPSQLCKSWHRTAAAHNTCVVNGQNGEMEHGGRLIHFDSHGVTAQSNPYPDTMFERTLSIKTRVLYDTFVVQCPRASTIDYFFHLQQPLEPVECCGESVSIFDDYAGFVSVHRLITTGQVVLHNAIATMTHTLEEGCQLFLAKSYDNPANLLRDTIIIRKTDALSATFTCQISHRAKATPHN